MPTFLPPFTIQQPASLDEASQLLLDGGDDARAYAGGTELLLVMKHGGLQYGSLIDIKTIPGLGTIEVSDGALRIGALATHLAVERSPLIRQHIPSLAELEGKVANPRVRASGTLGGNLCFGEPHSDPATLLLCLDATMQIDGPDGARSLPIDEFIVGPYETALAEGELLTSIDIPLRGTAWVSAYTKFQVRERPMLGLALALEIDAAAAAVTDARAAVGSASPIPVRGAEAEALLVGPISEIRGRLAEAGAALAAAADLLDDGDGSAAYKAHLIGVFLRQTFERLTAAGTERATA
ncbi:MAG: FAD binding domain-containing protein [Chloroflexi bacterium]|nr:FAD binding domain-containing protein [Chloroflexota bacterium]